MTWPSFSWFSWFFWLIWLSNHLTYMSGHSINITTCRHITFALSQSIFPTLLFLLALLHGFQDLPWAGIEPTPPGNSLTCFSCSEPHPSKLKLNLFFPSRFLYRKLSTCVCTKLLNHVWLFLTPWTVACQAPLSMGFSRQEYWSRLPFSSPGDLPNIGVGSRPPALQGIL